MVENEIEEIRYPSSRRFTFDVGRIGRGKHHVKALLEVDVTDARRKIKQNRQAGMQASFTATLVKVVADCVALHPQVNGINRPRRNKVVVFGEVDISIVIEKKVDGVRVPLPYVIRQAEQKTIVQIYSEIELAKSQIIENEGDYVLGERRNSSGVKLFASLPQWLRLGLMRIFVFKKPKRLKDMMGTVMITTTGMIGHTRGWIIPFSMHPLCLAFGSLNEKPLAYRGEVKIRETLHLTVLVDHDVIDGIPAARFVDDLVWKMELGDGL
jgi:pyruvate/2-oxoglutarate dehydrogenase complex dihydrolipoamide acyltransferase (E2) component